MSTAWDTYHRRADALTGVVAELDRTGRTDLPWDDDLAATFRDRDDLLVALHDLWSRRLMGRLDLALELHDIPGSATAEAWEAVAAELPGVRRVLDANADHPALARRRATELRMVALAAGVAGLGDSLQRSAARGAEFLAEAQRHELPGRRDGWLAERLAGLRELGAIA
jgi:hypothetical protein